MKAILELDFEVDGIQPTEQELAVVLNQAISSISNWVYVVDEDNCVLLLHSVSGEWSRE